MQAVSGPALRLAALLPLLALGACESSSRLGSLMPGNPVGPAPRVSQRAAPAPLTPAPVGEVYTSDLGGGGASTSALPPLSSSPSLPPSSSPSAASSPSRAGGLSAPGNLPGGGGTLGSPIDPPASPSSGGSTYYPAGSAPSAPQSSVATPPRVATTPVASAPPTRTSAVGNWQVSEAAGGSCRITLSSAPKLDLYGAGTNGCQSKELQRVNAWELSGSELLLYEPGGGVVARMRSSGGGYSGATAKTGAPVSLSK